MAVGNGFARFAYALLLPAMRTDLAWNYTQAGWLNTANALGYVVGAVSGYLLLRRYRPSILFGWGLWLTVISLGVTGLHPGIWWLTTMRVCSGIGAAWVFACGGALVAIRYQDNAAIRGTATGLFFSGAGIGIALSGICVNPLLASMGSHGWPYAWGLLGMLAALASIWPFYLSQRIGGVANSASAEPLVLAGLIPSLISYFVFAAGYIVYMTFIFAWLKGQGYTWQFATFIWIVLGVGVGISPFVWRRALGNWNPVHTLSASCFATLLGASIPIVTTSPAGILASAFIFGLGVFIAPSSVAALVRISMPSPQMAKGMTFFTVIFSIGQAIGPVLGGWIGDLGSLNSSLLLGSVLLLTAALLPLIKSRTAV